MRSFILIYVNDLFTFEGAISFSNKKGIPETI